MYEILSRVNWLLTEQFGFNAIRFVKGILKLPWFVSEFIKFRREFKDSFSLLPCLHDASSEAGSVSSEYFWQDLEVAQLIAARNPETHLDIGSQIDGFIAHLASFRKVDVGDLRELTKDITNVTFRRLDITEPADLKLGTYPSVSCLHTLEHIGLGRYGDKIDKTGWIRALSTLSSYVKDGGRLYLSVPVGKPLIYFNAHRVFDIQTIIKELNTCNMDISNIRLINSRPSGVNILSVEKAVDQVSREDYALAIFDCLKIK